MTYVELSDEARAYLEVLADSAFHQDIPVYSMTRGVLVVPQSDSPHVLDVMARVAEGNPYVQCLLTTDGREVLIYPLTGRDYFTEYAEDCSYCF